MRQEENRTAPEPAPGAPSVLDAIRVEQFLALQRELLLASGDPETLPDRLAQSVALFLGVRGAAVSTIEDGRYRLLGAYGLGAGYVRRYGDLPLRDSELAPALGGGRPIVLNDVDGDALLKTVVLPFRVADSAGALHIVVEESVVLSDERLELARMLAGLAAVALANARQCGRLARLAHLKGNALTTMAHDLRSPLNALVGYAALLAEGAFGALSGEQRDVAATLERQALELVDLLRATLDVARLETGRLPLRVEDFALADVVATLGTGTFAGPSRDGRIVWSVPPDLPPLHTDRVKVKEIVQNLVDNALKHGAGGRVSVEAAAAAGRDGVRITVRDAGPGIAPALLPALFEPFRPGPGNAQGTGFGLYIVKSFAEALGGRVAVRSEATGTAFTVELPVEAPGR